MTFSVTALFFLLTSSPCRSETETLRELEGSDPALRVSRMGQRDTELHGPKHSLRAFFFMPGLS